MRKIQRNRAGPSRGAGNPLGMRQLPDGGPFVLPRTLATARRQEFLQRANSILGFYVALTITANEGKKVIDAHERSGKFVDATLMRLPFEARGTVAQFNYGALKRFHATAGTTLTNQVFLMLYGNFEAFLSDLVLDALSELGDSADPEQEAIYLMMARKWPGKFDKMTQRLKVKLGKRVLVRHFSGIDMGFLGKATNDPRVYLQMMADLRHRLVHAGSRANRKFVARYPESGLKAGDSINVPFGLPLELQLIFTHLSEAVDEAFANRFGWERTMVAPESGQGA